MYSIYVSISQEYSRGTCDKSHSVYMTHFKCPVYMYLCCVAVDFIVCSCRWSSCMIKEDNKNFWFLITTLYDGCDYYLSMPGLKLNQC